MCVTLTHTMTDFMASMAAMTATPLASYVSTAPPLNQTLLPIQPTTPATAAPPGEWSAAGYGHSARVAHPRPLPCCVRHGARARQRGVPFRGVWSGDRGRHDAWCGFCVPAGTGREWRCWMRSVMICALTIRHTFMPRAGAARVRHPRPRLYGACGPAVRGCHARDDGRVHAVRLRQVSLPWRWS